jgi:hypothetical protein
MGVLKEVRSVLVTIGVLILLMCLACLAAIPVVVYRDHVGLVEANRKLRASVTGLSAEVSSLHAENQGLTEDISRLQAAAKSPVFTEPANSLRRRVIALASDAQMFFNEIHENNPPYGNGKDDAVGEQKRVNDNARRYWAEKESQCMDKFDIRTRGIVQELKAAGVDVGRGPDSPYLEDMIEQRKCIGMEPMLMTKLRKLAWFLDAHGRLAAFLSGPI